MTVQRPGAQAAIVETVSAIAPLQGVFLFARAIVGDLRRQTAVAERGPDRHAVSAGMTDGVADALPEQRKQVPVDGIVERTARFGLIRWPVQ